MPSTGWTATTTTTTTTAAPLAVALPTSDRPLTVEEADRTGAQDLKDSNVVFTALHASRRALLNDVFTRFSTKGGGAKRTKGKAVEDGVDRVQRLGESSSWRPHTLSLLAVTDAQIGPHIFYDVALYEACEDEPRPLSMQPAAVNGSHGLHTQPTVVHRPLGMPRGPYKPRKEAQILTPEQELERKERLKIRARERAAAKKMEDHGGQTRQSPGQRPESTLRPSGQSTPLGRPTSTHAYSVPRTGSGVPTPSRPSTLPSSTSTQRPAGVRPLPPPLSASAPLNKPPPSSSSSATSRPVPASPRHSMSGPIPRDLVAHLAAAANSDPRLSSLLTRVAEKRASKEELQILHNFIKESQSRGVSGGSPTASAPTPVPAVAPVPVSGPEPSSNAPAKEGQPSKPRDAKDAVDVDQNESEIARLRGGAPSEPDDAEDEALYGDTAHVVDMHVDGPRQASPEATQSKPVEPVQTTVQEKTELEEIPGFSMAQNQPSGVDVVARAEGKSPSLAASDPTAQSPANATPHPPSQANDPSTPASQPAKPPRKRAIVFEISESPNDRWILPKESILQMLSSRYTGQDSMTVYANIYTTVSRVDPNRPTHSKRVGGHLRKTSNGLGSPGPKDESMTGTGALGQNERPNYGSVDQDDDHLWSPLVISLLRPLHERLVRALKANFLAADEVRDLFAQRLARAAAEVRSHLVLRVPEQVTIPAVEPISERGGPRGERGSYKKSSKRKGEDDKEESDGERANKVKALTTSTHGKVTPSLGRPISTPTGVPSTGPLPPTATFDRRSYMPLQERTKMEPPVPVMVPADPSVPDIRSLPAQKAQEGAGDVH